MPASGYRSEAAAGREGFAVTRINGPLLSAFDVQGPLSSRRSHTSYLAIEKASEKAVKLSYVADLKEASEAEVEALARYLCEIGELGRSSALPRALLKVRSVLLASDLLAYTEEYFPNVPLAEVLRARSNVRRGIAFSEAMTFLQPIAIALDFLLANEKSTVSIATEEIWLTGASLETGSFDPQNLVLPLTEWPDFAAHFSMVCTRTNPGSASGGDQMEMDETVTGSRQMSAADLHPVPAFGRLLYRSLTGSEVAAAAGFTPTAYVPTVSLAHGSNVLLRDLLCHEHPWTTVTAVLKELCANEGVPWRPQPGIASHASEWDDPAAIRIGVDPAVHQAGERTAVIPIPDHGTGSSDREPLCEVLQPGLVRSPFEPEGDPIKVSAAQWIASGRVRCPASGRYTRLPAKLDPLVATVVSPGLVLSPHASQPQRVPWEAWAPGRKIKCEESGKALTLPFDLPPPEAALPPGEPGIAISPFDLQRRIAIPPDDWTPGARLACPTTQRVFVLPADLPSLQAIADPARPGILESPYAPGVAWELPPPSWMAGGRILCPHTQKPLTLPAAVEAWEAVAVLLDGAARLVENPYRPGESVEVPARLWIGGGKATCAGPNGRARSVRLPSALPLLTGGIVENRPGQIVSPYTGEVCPVPREQWTPGGRILCPTSGIPIILPAALPEWVEAGTVSGLPPGKVRSPYAPHPEIAAHAENWTPGFVLTCPATGLRFSLPSDLPLLEGRTEKGTPGCVCSPFHGDVQEVKPDEWRPGQQIECAFTHRPFRLPQELEDWAPEGGWVPGFPGRVRSPYKPFAEVDAPESLWSAGGILECPKTRRRFRITNEPLFPSYALERDAFDLALNDPEASESDATKQLRARHPSVSVEQIRAIWARHQVGSVEQRGAAIETAEALPGFPGYVRSPYGSKPRVEVTASQWIDPAARMRCPETKRLFKLPPDLPPLLAMPVRNDPGMVESPFAPGVFFQVNPDKWKPGETIRCPKSGQSLKLPAALPPWRPEGKLKDAQAGTVFSPFGRKLLITVRGNEWVPGGPLRCPETGNRFVLPRELPAVAATTIAGRPGFALSPYTGDEIAVPRDKWKPGINLVCPKTKRTFILPPSLPPWPRPLPWMPILASVLIAGAAIATWVHFKTPAPKLGGEREKERRASPPATQPPVAPAPMADLSGGLAIEYWQTSQPPPGLAWSYNGARQRVTSAEQGRGGAFNLKLQLPDDARDKQQIDVDLSLPGWSAVRCSFVANGQGGFTEERRLLMKRERASLPLRIRGRASDYDRLVAAWRGPLGDQPGATPPDIGSISTPIKPLTEPIPTGIYDFRLEGQDPRKVTPFEWQRSVEVRASMKPLTLPPSVSGEHWGLLRYNAEYAYFFVVKIAPKLASLETDYVALPSASPVFAPQNVRPLVGDIWRNLPMKLDQPGVLHFSCPIYNTNTDWTLTASQDGTLNLMPDVVLAKNKDMSGLRERLIAHIKASADEARTTPGAELKYELKDYNNVTSPGGFMASERYKAIAPPDPMDDRLYRFITFWSTEAAAIHKNAAGIRMYPFVPLKKVSDGAGAWHAEPAAK